MKLNLDKTYIHSGKFYGPGETEVPDSAAEDLKAHMEEAAPTPLPLDSTAAGQQHPDDGAAGEQPASAAPKPATKRTAKKGGK